MVLVWPSGDTAASGGGELREWQFIRIFRTFGICFCVIISVSSTNGVDCSCKWPGAAARYSIGLILVIGDGIDTGLKVVASIFFGAGRLFTRTVVAVDGHGDALFTEFIIGRSILSNTV